MSPDERYVKSPHPVVFSINSNAGSPIFVGRLEYSSIIFIGDKLNIFMVFIKDRIFRVLLYLHLGCIEISVDLNTVFIIFITVSHNILLLFIFYPVNIGPFKYGLVTYNVVWNNERDIFLLTMSH